MPKPKYTPGGFDLAVRRTRAGRGLFAQEAIPKGACVIEYVGRTLSEEEETTSRSRYLFEVADDKTIDGWDKRNTARYINHSCKPNCQVEIHRRRVFIMAKRKIVPGEELGYDYGKNYFDSFIKPIGCRCPKCMSEQKWLKLKRKIHKSGSNGARPRKANGKAD